MVEVEVEEVGIGQGHSITSCQVRCPNKEWGTIYGQGRPGVSGGRAFRGEQRVGPASRWATQEGHVDPEHGQRRKVAKSKNNNIKKVKERGRRGRRNTVLIEYKLHVVPIVKREKLW